MPFRRCCNTVVAGAERVVCSTTWLCVLMAVCVALLSLVVRVQDTLKLQAAVQQTDLLFTVPGAADGAAPLDTAQLAQVCLLYTSPSPRDRTRARMPSSA